MSGRSDARIAAWLTLFLYGIYLLSFSGRFFSQDSMLMFSVTESMVKRGEFNADQMWTIYKARDELGPDGESYSKTGYGTSLLNAPLYAVALALPGVGLVQTTLLTSSIAMALAGGLVYLAARRLDYGREAGLVLALLFGLGTPAWVYAKQLWSEPFALVTLFAAFYFLLCFRGERRGRDAVLAGIALGLAVATRVSNAVLVPFFAWYGFSAALREPKARRGLVLFAGMLALAALSIAWYDWVRYGSPLATGYRADEGFNNPILLGLYGLLFSPGKGLFVYVPFLAVLPWAGGIFYRRARAELGLVLAVSAIYLVTFSTWYYWWGGTNWSPRFLVPLLPFLVLLAAPAVALVLGRDEENCGGVRLASSADGMGAASSPIAGPLSRSRSRFRTGGGGEAPTPAIDVKGRVNRKARSAFAAIFAGLCIFSVVIELLGISVPALSYRQQMMRVSANPESDAIFLPAFSPLAGYFNLLRPKVLDFAWIRPAGGDVSIEWSVVGLTVAFVLCCGVVLAALFAQRQWQAGRVTLLVGVVLAGALSFYSLYHYVDDPRFGAGDGYRALLQAVRGEAQARDVVILNNDIFAPFLMNENRSTIRWYGLSRDPNQWDESTQTLLARLAHDYPRIWFAVDDSTANLPDPTSAWLDGAVRRVSQQDFVEGVHLVLYETGVK